MAGATDQQVRDLAMLKAGRKPVTTVQGVVDFPHGFVTLSAATTPPASSADMQSLGLDIASGNALRAYVEILLRRNPAYRTALYQISVFDLSTDYSIILAGDPYLINGTTDLATTLGLLRDAINDGTAFTGPATIKGRLLVEILTYAVGTTYHIELDGYDHTAVAAGSTAATALALEAAIEAGPVAGKFAVSVVNSIVVIDRVAGRADTYEAEASVVASTGTIESRRVPATATLAGTTITVVGTHPDDYTASWATVTGAGLLTMDADATEVTAEVWGLLKGRTVPCVLDGAEPVTYTRNALIPVDCGGLSHLQLRIVSTDGRVSWGIGVVDLEGSS